MMQLLCSQAKEKLQEEVLKINKHNLYVRPSAAPCSFILFILHQKKYLFFPLRKI